METPNWERGNHKIKREKKPKRGKDVVGGGESDPRFVTFKR